MGGGDKAMNPKPIQELLLGTESNATILVGGGGGGIMSRVLLTSIVGRYHGKGKRSQDGSCTLRVIAGP